MPRSITMKAWTCRRYGGPDALALEDVPVRPLRPGDVSIRVRATTVSAGDARIRALRLPRGFNPFGRLIFGFRGPRQPILGVEASGVIEAVGEAVDAFRPGDAVIAFPDFSMGAHAEYLTMPANGLIVAKPARLSFEEAASVCFGGLTAQSYIGKAALEKGERLLVIGASGAVGGAFVQLAKDMGVHVTAVTSGANAGLARALGADEVISYTSEDFTALGRRWDVIADTVGASDFKRCLPLLEHDGRYLAIAGGLSDMLARGRGGKRSRSGPARSRLEDLQELVRQAETGAWTPSIDSVFSFDRMREAHARVDTGRKKGSVVVLGPSA